MRQRVTSSVIETFMFRLARNASSPGRVFMVGGASAVLLGWRDSTIDVDLKFLPETDALLRSLPELKEILKINVEIASPDHFIPELPGWQDRSVFIKREGALDFFHYDFYAQALAKIERGHDIDLRDVDEMIGRGLVERSKLFELFSAIEDQLYRYPAVDGKSFRAAVDRIVRKQ